MLLCGDHTVTPELVLLRQDSLVAPSFRDGFTSVSSITHRTTVRDLGQRFNPANLGVDETRRVQLCAMRGRAATSADSGGADTRLGGSSTRTRW